jgi:hypothetical protein
VFQVQDQAPEHCGERFFKDAISSEAAPHVSTRSGLFRFARWIPIFDLILPQSLERLSCGGDCSCTKIHFRAVRAVGGRSSFFAPIGTFTLLLFNINQNNL